MKVGDKVWVLCEVVDTMHLSRVSCKYGPTHFRALVSEVKPVELEAVEHSDWKEVRIRGKGDCAMSIECINLTKSQVLDILRNQNALFRLAGVCYNLLDGQGSVMLVPDDGVVRYVEGEGQKEEKAK